MKLPTFQNVNQMFVKFCLFLSLLISSQIFAKWVEIGRNEAEGLAVFFESDSLQKTKDQSQVKVLYNFAKPNTDFNISHSSEVEWVTFDCKKRSLRLDDVQWFKSQSAKGPVVWKTKNLEWQKLERGSSYEVLFAQICLK